MNNSEILLQIGIATDKFEQDILKLEKKIGQLEKKKSTVSISTDKQAFTELERQISSLKKQLIELEKEKQKLISKSLSFEQQAHLQSLKNKENKIRLEIEKEKSKYKEIENLQTKWEMKYDARLRREFSALEHAKNKEMVALENHYKKEEKAFVASRTKIAAKQKEYSKTFLGAFTEGTTFMHKMATTAQYATAGAALYGVSNAVLSIKDAIIETDKYFNMFRGVLELNEEKAKALQQSIFNVGKEFGGTNQQLSEAALQLGRAGLEGEKLANGLKVASQMALIAGDSLENITEMLSAWQTVYPEQSIEHLGDMMVKIANASLLSIDGLKTATSYILATGHAAGMTSDSLIQLAGAWKQTGKADSIVGTEVRRLFEHIENASEDVRKAYWAMGVDITKVNEGLKSESEQVRKTTFSNFMKMVADVEKLPKAQRDSINKLISGLQVLDKGTTNSNLVASKAYAKMEKEGNEAAGAREEAAAKVAASYEKMIERIIIAGKEASVKFEESFTKTLFGDGEDAAKKFEDMMDSMSESLNSLAETTGEAAAVIVDNFDKIALAAALYKVGGWLDKGFIAHGAALAAQAIAVGKLSKAWKVLNIVVSRNPLVIAAMAGITIYGLLADDTYDAAAAVDEFYKANKKAFDDNSTVESIEAQIEAYERQIEARAKVVASLEPDSDAYKTQIEHLKTMGVELTKLYAIIDKKRNTNIAGLPKLDLSGDISASGTFKEKDKNSGSDDGSKALREKFKMETELIKLAEKEWLWQNQTATALEKQAYHTDVTLQATADLAKSYEGVKGLSDDIVKSQTELKDGQVELSIAQRKNKEAAEEKIAQNNYELSIMRDITEEAKLRNELTMGMKGVHDSYLNSQQTEYDLQVAQSDVLKVQAEYEYKLEELARTRALANEQVTLELQAQRNAQIEMLNYAVGLSPAQSGYDAAAAQYQIEQRQLELQLIEDIRNAEDPAQIQAINDAYLARTALLKENLEYMQAMAELEIKIEGLDKLREVFDSFSNLSSASESFEKTQKGLLSFSSKMLDMSEDQAKYDKKILALNTLKTNGDIDQVEYNKRLLKLDEEKFATQMQGYSAVSGAVSQMFEEGSREAAAFKAIEAGLAVVAGVQAILTQGKGDPYTAFARMAAMTAAVASMLGNAGIAFGANKTTTTSDAFSAMETNTGTGSVLGDTSAQSKSIENSLETLSDYAKPEFSLLAQMNKSLLSIDQKIGGMAGLLIREGGYAFGEGYEGFDTGFSNNIGINNTAGALLGGAGALAGLGVAGGVGAYGGLALGGPIGLAALGIDQLLLGGMFTDMLGGAFNSVLGGLFGKTSVSQTMTDSGIYFANALLTQAKEDFDGSAYQTIKTTTTKKSWFSSSSSTTVSTYFKALDSELENQFSMVLGGLYETTVLAGEALDTSYGDIENELSDFVVSIGKISLKDKTGEEIQEELNAVFGEIADDIARDVFPALDRFQKVGEGLFDTMTRVATGMEEAEYYIDRLGKGFEDLSYTELLNPSGNVGVEALAQSIRNSDAETQKFSDSLVDLAVSVSETSEELFELYNAFNSIGVAMEFMAGSGLFLTQSMIYGAGSTDALGGAINDYIENFYTQSEQAAYQFGALNLEFEKLNLATPTTKDEFRELLESFDLTTESGQELYGRVILLSDAFDEASTAAEELAQDYRDLFARIDAILGAESFQTLESLYDLVGTATLDNANEVIDKLEQARDSELNSIQDIINAVEELRALSDSIRNSVLGTNIQRSEAQYKQLYDTIYTAIQDGNSYSEYLSDFSAYANDYAKAIQGEAASTSEYLYKSLVLANDIDALADMQGDVTLDDINATFISYITELRVSLEKQFEDLTGKDTLKVLLTGTETGMGEYLKLLYQVQADAIAKESAPLTISSFKAGHTLGTQEKIDFAKATGLAIGSPEFDKAISDIQGFSTTTTDYAYLKELAGVSGTTVANPEIMSALKSLNNAGYLPADASKAYTSVVSTLEKNAQAEYDERKLRGDAADRALATLYANFYRDTGITTRYNSSLLSNSGFLNDLRVAGNFQNAIKSVDDAHYGYSGWIADSTIDKIKEISTLNNNLTKQTYFGFATGTPSVPYDMTANIHQGEIIVPKTFSDGLRAGDLMMGNNNDVIAELKALRAEITTMKNLSIKQTATQEKQLSTQRALLGEQMGVA